MPANPLPVNEVFCLDAIFEQFVQIRRQPRVPRGRTGFFLSLARGGQRFFWKLKNFVQKLFEVSKSLLYSELRCFGIYALPVGFVVETGGCPAAKCC